MGEAVGKVRTARSGSTQVEAARRLGVQAAETAELGDAILPGDQKYTLTSVQFWATFNSSQQGGFEDEFTDDFSPRQYRHAELYGHAGLSAGTGVSMNCRKGIDGEVGLRDRLLDSNLVCSAQG